MPTAFVTPLSRTLAGSLCLSEGMLTPVDLALWLAAMADELVRVDDPDATGVTLRDAWRTAEDDAAPIYIAGRKLLAATGLRTHGALVRPFERLAGARLSLGLDGDGYRPWHGWEVDPIGRDNPVDRGIVSGMLLTMGMIHDTRYPVSVNLSAMARFRSRVSPLLYLRALAWLAGAGTPKAWRRSPPGDRVTVTVPMGDLHRAIGVPGGAMVGDWAGAFGPGGRGGSVHADLATAGIRLSTEWRMSAAGYGTRQVPTGLRITLSRVAGAERRPLPRRPRQSSSSSASAVSRP